MDVKRFLLLGFSFLIFFVSTIAKAATEDLKQQDRDHLGSASIKPIVEKNEKYMTMHESDYSQNKESWDKTLHRPLQNYVVKVMDTEFKQQPIHFIYIGVGSYAPLFQDQQVVEHLKNRLDEITLIDISKEALALSKNIVSEKFPLAKINVVVADVTRGAAQSFTTFIGRLFEKLESETLTVSDYNFIIDDVKLRQDNPSLGAIFKNRGINKGDFIYSEMVVTFTGTPVMYSLEKKLGKLSGKLDKESIGNFLENTRVLWQKFNDQSFAMQVENYVSLINDAGILAIAGDTNKIFDDNKQPSISTFFSQKQNFPVIKAENNVCFQYAYPPILWRDISDDKNIKSRVAAHEAHTHECKDSIYMGDNWAFCSAIKA